MMKKVLNYINMFSLLWLVLTWLFGLTSPRWLAYGGIELFVASWLAECIVERRWQEWQWDARTLYFFLPLLLFSLAFIYAPFDTGTHFGRLIEHRLGLFTTALFGLFGVNKRYTLRGMFRVLTVLAVGTSVYVICRAGGVEWLMAPNKTELFAAARNQYVNAHMQFNFTLCVALIGIWYCVFRDTHTPRWWGKALYLLSAVFLMAMLALSEGRSGFIAGLGIVGVLSVIEAMRFRKWLGWTTIALAVVLGGIALTHHNRMSAGELSSEPRLQLWKSAIELIEERPVLGYGMSRAQEEFSKVSMRYTDDVYRACWHDQIAVLDTHNQYLQAWLEFGVLGLVLVLLIYITPMFIDTRHRLLSIMVCGLCMFLSMFDMFITGTFCIPYNVLALMLLAVEWKQSANPNEICK
ncbi:MAG: O-antigen ligase family protein [Paludibacteraceae bacterium]|nr:O-antigen ligase family protein [Paludibacteraceae bacterium]